MKQVYLFKYGLTVLLFICAISAFAQTNSFSGKVVDETNQPLPGATVSVKGSQQATVTDADGKFKLSGNNQSAVAITVTFVGYDVLERTLTINEPVSIQLIPNQKSLSEVVVIGYGTVKRKDLTGAVSNLSAKDLNPGSTTNPLQQLEGRAPGVTVTQSGSEPGTAPGIRIRGITSLQGGNDPLYVVDGIQGNSDLLNQVPPSEILSVDILKDASATAIYGSRGAPGVIIVTTKHNAAGVSSIEYTANVSLDVIPKKLNELTAAEWSANASRLDVDPSADHGSNTDWYDLLTRNGITQNHTLAFGGGGKDFSYRASISSIYQQGVVIAGSDYHNYIGRITATQKALDNKLTLTMNLNSGINKADYSGPAGGQIGNAAFTSNLISNAYIARPTDPVLNEDGTYFTDGTVFQYLNPVAAAKNLINDVSNNNLFGSLRADVDIYKGLTAGIFGSWRKIDGDNGLYEPVSSTYAPAIAVNGIANISNNHTDERLMDWDLDYKHDFGKSHLHALALYEWQAQTYNGDFAQTKGFISDATTYNALQLGNGVYVPGGDITSYKNQKRLVSYLGRVEYSYNDRYYLTASIRSDGSTLFGSNYKRGNFPSASLAWKIDQEDFMKGQQVVSTLKLRGGYGVTGNAQGLIPQQSIPLLATNGSVQFGGQTLTNYVPSQNPNNDLRWETRKQTDIGLDFGFMNDKLTGTVDVYNATTTNLLYNYPVTVTSVFPVPNIFGNAGTMNNKGIELALSYNVIKTQDMSLTLAGNASYLKNKLVNLTGTIEGQAENFPFVPWGFGATYLIPGQPVGTFELFQHKGVDANGAETYVTANADGKPTQDGTTISPDKRNYGSALPKYNYAFTPSFTYKNFDASMVWYGSGGNEIYNTLEESLSLLGNIGKSNLLESAIPKGIHSAQFNSNEWLESGNYLRFANLSFGYKFNLTNVKYISALRVSLTGQNLALITKYTGLDPEIDASGDNNAGRDNGNYPRTRTFSLGLNVIFK